MLHNGSRISQLIPKTVVVENEEVSIRGPAGDLNDISERRRKRVAGLRMAKENGGRPGFVAGGPDCSELDPRPCAPESQIEFKL
jgi:hypothetical protein